jgi:hypothetical protein
MNLNNISLDCCPGPKEVKWPLFKAIGQRSYGHIDPRPLVKGQGHYTHSGFFTFWAITFHWVHELE